MKFGSFRIRRTYHNFIFIYFLPTLTSSMCKTLCKHVNTCSSPVDYRTVYCKILIFSDQFSGPKNHPKQPQINQHYINTLNY